MFWSGKDSEGNFFTHTIDTRDKVLAQRIISGLRDCAYKALRNDDQASIDILALAVIHKTLDYWQPLPPVSSTKEDSHDIITLRDFRIMFDLEENAKWRSCLERGRVELERNPARAAIKKYNDQRQYIQ